MHRTRENRFPLPGFWLVLTVTGFAALSLVLISDTAASAQAAAVGDIFESGANFGLVKSSVSPQTVIPGMIPIMVPADIFALGTDEYKSKNTSSDYNNDPRDPFYYAAPSSDRQMCIGYRPATVSELIDTTMGWQAGPLAARKLKDPGAHGERKWIWKNNLISQPRWPIGSMPLKVYISRTVQTAQGGRVAQAIESALQQWAAASSGVVRYEITDQFLLADLSFAEGSDHPGIDCWGEEAAVDVRYHKGQIDQARVSFSQPSLRFPWRSLRGLCLREVGHALGIINNSANACDATSWMSSSYDHPVITLSAADKEAIAGIYARIQVPQERLQTRPIASAARY